MRAFDCEIMAPGLCLSAPGEVMAPPICPYATDLHLCLNSASKMRDDFLKM